MVNVPKNDKWHVLKRIVFIYLLVGLAMLTYEIVSLLIDPGKSQIIELFQEQGFIAVVVIFLLYILPVALVWPAFLPHLIYSLLFR